MSKSAAPRRLWVTLIVLNIAGILGGLYLVLFSQYVFSGYCIMLMPVSGLATCIPRVKRSQYNGGSF